MFTPWGPSAVPTGGAGFAAPAGSWSLSIVLIGFAIMIVLILKFLHLDRVELDGRLAAEHAHHDLDLALLEIDLLHLAIVILEGTVDDLYRFAYQEVNFEFRLLLAHAHHEIVDLFLRERRRRSAVRAHEAGHARRIPHHVPGIFREDHVDKILTEDSWYVVRNTPRVTGFVGSNSTTPTPLSKEEIDDLMMRMGKEEPKFKVDFRVGETVKIIDGPFKDYDGKVEEVDLEKGNIKVMVGMSGRETAVELDSIQVQKL